MKSQVKLLQNEKGHILFERYFTILKYLKLTLPGLGWSSGLLDDPLSVLVICKQLSEPEMLIQL